MKVKAKAAGDPAAETMTAALTELVTRMERGDLSPLTAFAGFALDERLPLAQWTSRNVLLVWTQWLASYLASHGADVPRDMPCAFATYNQWQSFGRQVRKGAKAVYGLSPRTVKTETEGEDPAYRCVGWRRFPVHHISDTDPIEGAEEVYEPLAMAPPERDDLEAALAAVGVRVVYGTPTGGGAYLYKVGVVEMGTPDAYVLAHEAGHAFDHKLHAHLWGDDGYDYADGEVVAETAAAVWMATHRGEDHSGSAYQYLARYAREKGQTPVDAVRALLPRILAVLDAMRAHT